ncbi:Gfo/Idh/MocA family oxidoreductase, partial [Schleiferiaceae bacterium]|nr:Gfo/Idh/MocA family oxidoreductase [Schleiferiaceae bacterium]
QERAYPSWAAMLEGELALPADERVQVVMITTPNHVHAAPTIAALESGFHVVLDKPLCTSMEEALAMEAAAKGSKRLFCLTHTYTGYPMIKEAKHQIASGALGTVRKIYVEYPQGWLSTFLEGEDHTQAAWRTDPKKSGKVGAMGDIGTHAFNLAEYVSGEEIVEVCAQLNTVVDGRALDDDGAVLFRTASGATGVLMATQIAAGEENNVKIRVFGEKGGLCWEHADNNSLTLMPLDAPVVKLRTGGPGTSDWSLANHRVPPGHPEGYLEAFANLYKNFAAHIRAQEAGEEQDAHLDYPGIEDGVRGMKFIEAIVANNAGTEKYTAL